MTPDKSSYVVLGAGVAGLTTALELKACFPQSKVTIVAKYLPGDRVAEYASPWAGANWQSIARDNGRQESWDEVTFHKFARLAVESPECGIQTMELRALYDNKVEDAGILSQGTGKVWYETLAPSFRWLKGEELKGAQCGFEVGTFMINVQIYLAWLQGEVQKKGIEVRRKDVSDIRDLFKLYPSVKAVFNCSGIGSYRLKGVEDTSMYPVRGQILLVENPAQPISRMYTRAPERSSKDATYIFPRNPGGGVILGGCRLEGAWDGEVDLKLAEDIKTRCCNLVPELGKPQDLKVISHGVGLRPSRKGGARIEKEVLDSGVVVHNYGAGGAGYQSSWGMAKAAVDLLQQDSKL